MNSNTSRLNLRNTPYIRLIRVSDLYTIKHHMRLLKFEQFGPRQANLLLIAYASSEGSGEPAHPRSLARTFAARSYKQ